MADGEHDRSLPGGLQKAAFDGYVDTRCARQLHIRLGEGDPRWIAREIRVRHHPAGPAEDPLARLGRDYEQRVYARLRLALGAAAVAELRPPRRREVASTRLTPARLRELHAGVLAQGGAPLVLLEHAWPLSPRFVRQVYGLAPDAPLPTAGDRQAARWLRPDLHLIGRIGADAQGARVLGPDGAVGWASGAALAGRLGITLADIKHVHPARVGRRHLVELLFYAQALAAWLAEAGLEDCFFVRVDGHGILASQEDEALLATSPETLGALLVPLVWDDVAQLSAQTQAQIRVLWGQVQAGGGVDDAEPCIQPACGRCPFIDDCIQQLRPAGQDGRGWDVRLVPYLPPTVAQQLRAAGVETVGALLDRLAAGTLVDADSTVPTPLHAEVPSLHLRARALAEGRLLLPARTDGYLSLALPHDIHLALVLDLEVDPIHEVVFGLGLYLDVRCPPRQSALAERQLRWWTACRDHLQTPGGTPSALLQALDLEGLEALYAGEDLHGWLADGVQAAAAALAVLWAEGAGGLTIALPGEVLGGVVLQTPVVRHRYSYVSGGLEPHHELRLLANLVQQAHALLRLSTVIEDLVLAVDPIAGTVQRSRLAGFFWSREQVDHLRALVERHLPELRTEEALSQQFGALVDWMTPAESDVGHPALHRKMYDLRAFVEGAVGLPQIIRYPWHATLAAVRQARGISDAVAFDPRFWAPHFSYMDMTPWHEALAEADTTRRAAREQHIRTELDRKTAALHEILRHLHRAAQEILPRESVVLSNREFSPPDVRFQRLAQLWYRYSRLNAATAAIAADGHRTAWPAQAIARLRAGHLSGLEIREDDHEEDGVLYDRFCFRLEGLSSNIRADAGDHVLLLHRDLRDLGVGPWLADRAAPLRILSMDWDAAAQGYRVAAVSRAWGADAYRRRRSWVRSGRPEDALYALLERLSPEGWHVYLSAGDVWSGRLGGNRDALLTRQGLGTSWLGQWRLFLQGLSAAEVLPAPPALEVGGPEVYLYAPERLPRGPAPDRLHTASAQALDASQAAAIRLALAGPVACIQGPPGTGKSQTIAALIDEAAHRAAAEGRPLRVLVSAFSYPALRVVARKLRAGAAGRLPILFARSAGREPEAFAGRPDLPDVVDLCYRSGAWYADGHKLRLSGGIHHGDLLDRAGWAAGLDVRTQGLVLFANAHTLYHLGRAHPSPRHRLQLFADDFGFDLIIVDEASQLPVDHLAAVVPLVRPLQARLVLPPRLAAQPEDLALALPPESAADLTRLVLVGDQAQLPPVRQILPPRRIAPLLGSALRYMLEVAQVPAASLAYNYRSHPDIVACIRRLGLYEALHAACPAPSPLPLPLSPELPPWLAGLLAPARVVATLVHDTRTDTALSPLEAHLTVELLAALWAQAAPADAAAERRFWAEEVGVVSPHNAHGRLIIREAAARLLGQSRLDGAALMAALAGAVTSVERFQGSDRRIIVGTVGVSAGDQLAAEEEFLYDMSRLNVLISRAKQKMVLICSRSFLDHVPRDRERMAVAARLRELAGELCGQAEAHTIRGEPVVLRWMASEGAARGDRGILDLAQGQPPVLA